MFAERSVPVTVCAVATAMARNVEAIAAMNEAGWKIATHGLRWIDYRDTPPDVEAPYRRGDPHPHRGRGRAVTRLLPGPFVDEHHPARDGGGRLFYCGGSYADDLPYWFDGPRGLQLITPYTLDSNDMRFATPQGFNSGGQFYAYLKDTFGTLYAEGDVAPKMLSVGLHCRLVGCRAAPRRSPASFDYALAHDRAWVPTRLDIARHGICKHPPPGGWKPSRLTRTLFLERFGGVYEHSAWVAAAAYDAGLSAEADTAEGLAEAMRGGEGN